MDKNQIQQAITQGQTQGVVTQQGKKYPLVHSLPSSIVNNLPEIVRLEISQLKLKQAPQNEKQQFVNHVFNTFDPNFYSEEEAKANQATVYQFIEDCELTLNEMIKAIQMVLNGELINEKSEQIEIRHKISLISLYEIKRAYIQHKNADYNHTKGRKMIDEATAKKQEAKPLSDEEKVLLFFTGLLTDFEDYKERKTLPVGATRHYIPLYCLGLLPKHDDHFREQMKQRALQELQKDMTLTNDRKERSFLKQIIESQMTDEGRFRTKVRELILMDFFQKIIDENKNISDVIREKTNGKTHREILEIIRW